MSFCYLTLLPFSHSHNRIVSLSKFLSYFGVKVLDEATRCDVLTVFSNPIHFILKSIMIIISHRIDMLIISRIFMLVGWK